MTQPGTDQEEYFENIATGVEAEAEIADEEEPVIEKPWNPDEIRVNTKSWAVRNILDMIDDGDLELAPVFQRGRVWTPIQKSRLIESILLQIPLPSFYFVEEKDGMMRVVDGLQRLSTIHEFTRGINNQQRFALRSLEYLSDVTGKRFDDLAQSWQRRINNTQLYVHVIDPQTPDPVKFDIFKRINTGGSPLNAQEIRHCMSGQRARDFLSRCVEAPTFQQATGGALKDHVRMADKELALRYCAFRLVHDPGIIGGYQTLDAFLTAATRLIDNELDEVELETLYEDFSKAMSNCKIVFGEYAFRKWPLDLERRTPINRALFESWAVGLTDYSAKQLESAKYSIVNNARDAMTSDYDYIGSISLGTAHPRKVQFRFEKAREIIAESLS